MRSEGTHPKFLFSWSPLLEDPIPEDTGIHSLISLIASRTTTEDESNEERSKTPSVHFGTLHLLSWERIVGEFYRRLGCTDFNETTFYDGLRDNFYIEGF